MSKTDATRAAEIYETFTTQACSVVQYLSVAERHQHYTDVEVPELAYAPINLGRQLREYLDDPDFEVYRRQYLAELEAKKSKRGPSAASTSAEFAKPSSSTLQPSPPPAKPDPKKDQDADLIDLFESINQSQTPMADQSQQQQRLQMQTPWDSAPFQPHQLSRVQTGFVSQPTGFPATVSFQQRCQLAFSPTQQTPQQAKLALPGAGSGIFSTQPPQQPSSLPSIPEDSVASFQNAAPQTTTLFHRPLLMNQQTNTPFVPAPKPAQHPATRESYSPFVCRPSQAAQPLVPLASNSLFQAQPTQQPVTPLETGTDSFAGNFGFTQPNQPTQPQRPVTARGILSQPTINTNPFRQGAFVNHNSGMGWQHNQQPNGGRLNQLQTVQVQASLPPVDQSP